MSTIKSYLRKRAARDDDDPDFVSVGVDGLIAASSRLLAVNRGLAEPDERDHLAFKQVVDVPSQIRERIRIDEGRKRRKTFQFTTKVRNLSAWHANVLGGPIRGQFVGNSLSSDTEQTNPMLSVEQLRRVTQMGPGGIGSDQAITEDMVALHASQFGFVSCVEGPESEKIGVDTRLAYGTRIGSDGRLYQAMRNTRTGKVEYVSPADLLRKTVKIND